MNFLWLFKMLTTRELPISMIRHHLFNKKLIRISINVDQEISFVKHTYKLVRVEICEPYHYFNDRTTTKL